VRVSRTLWDVTRSALDAAARSDGLLSPALLNELEAAGYDRTFDELVEREARGGNETFGPVRSSRGPAVGVHGPGWQAIETDPARRTIRLPEGVRLDLGGNAKGWAADRAVRRLACFGAALVDAGGDIAVYGPRPNGDPWGIAVADPILPDRDLTLLKLVSGGIATSGIDYRRWLRDGVWKHHLIDPRTGEPAETDLLSATVIASTTAEAEAAAKTVMLLGAKAGMAYIEQSPALACLTIDRDGRIRTSASLQPYLWR
jgi:thiamine biosynthesis lipoprotein